MCLLQTCVRTLLVGCLSLWIVTYPASAQLLTTPSAQTAAVSGPKTIPVSHYYWYLLRHQKALDDLGAKLSADGKDGNGPRNYLQKKLGFTDVEYAPVRIASYRLSTEISQLNGKASKAQKGDVIPEVREGDLRELAAEKERDIEAEIAFLKQALPPEKIATLEAFAVQFFMPSKAINPSLQSSQKETP